MKTVGSEMHKDAFKKQLLINIFEILVEQGLLSAEENYCLKVELGGQNKKTEYAKSRNI